MQIIAIEHVQIWLPEERVPSLTFLDIPFSYPNHNNIIPSFVLNGTGWYSGGWEIKNITSTSATMRFLNSTNRDLEGYLSLILFYYS